MYVRTHGFKLLRAAIVWLLVWPAPGWGSASQTTPPPAHCSDSLAALQNVAQQQVVLRGTTPATFSVATEPDHDYLIEVRLAGNDAQIEVESSDHRTLARFDHPERRSGTRRSVVAAAGTPSLTVRITGKEHDAVIGTARLRVVDLAGLSSRPACRKVLELLSAANSDYAIGQDVRRARSGQNPANARHAFLRAAEEYRAAHASPELADDPALRGESALALAGVEYFDLSNWRESTTWATQASSELDGVDPYRKARADAILAAAWIELLSGVAPDRPIPGLNIRSTELIPRAFDLLKRLAAFHQRRGELYDAALQINNEGIAQLYTGRYAICSVTFRRVERMLASLKETPRQATAEQNRAMCEWGRGELAEARRSLNEALTHMRLDPYPMLFIGAINNSALLSYAIGDFDAALRLDDKALSLALRVQSTRQEAVSLFGIGETYYALGNLARARVSLERSLALRTVTADPRGRIATLRALATLDSDEGYPERAIARDREALGLAPTSVMQTGIRLQMATHLAVAGKNGEALDILTKEIQLKAETDPLLVGRAFLQRAALRRRGGDVSAALGDLAAARPLLSKRGSVRDLFGIDLETARAQRASGAVNEALAFVDHALSYASAMRLQTANPEFRTHLQAPLREAFELKVDLLWDLREIARAAGNEETSSRLAFAAFDAADASRAQTFADIAAAQYPEGLRLALAPELARRDSLYRDIADRRFMLEALQDKAGSTDAGTSDLLADIARLERILDNVNNTIAERANARSPLGSAVGISQLVDRMPHDTALISYWIGSERTYSWVATAAGLHWIQLEAPREVNASARHFYESLSRTVDVQPNTRLAAGGDLYRRIALPLDQWAAEKRIWLVIPDGTLDYVPFAALRGTGESGAFFVVTRHDVATVPAAWMLKSGYGRPAAPGQRLLLVADPVYEAADPRLTHSAELPDTDGLGPAVDAAEPNVRRLPFTARESTAIASQFAPSDVERLEGVSASRDRLLGLDWSRYRYIHLAMHAIADAANPQYSSLLLSRYDAAGKRVDGRIRVADLELLSLNADSVIFSGCETAFGKEVPSEGLLGIGYTTLARGGRAVIASLWPASDEMSARLMTEFYQHLRRGAMQPMLAINAAMRDILLRDPSADPALWAPYQVSVVTLGASTEADPGVAGRDIRTKTRGGMK
jgi:CHAT domain-containing protein/tetratricopeptide (TPR) repeat protein